MTPELMDMDALIARHAQTERLVAVGYAAERAGFRPEFDLTSDPAIVRLHDIAEDGTGAGRSRTGQPPGADDAPAPPSGDAGAEGPPAGGTDGETAAGAATEAPAAPDEVAPDAPPPAPGVHRTRLGADWTAEDEARLMRMVEDGADLRAIAARLQRTEASVRTRYYLIRNRAAAKAASRTWRPVGEVAAEVVRKVAPAPAPARDEGLSFRQRAIVAWLSDQDRPADWSPQDDLALVEALFRGRKLGDLAAEQGRTCDQTRARWRALTGGIAPPGSGGITLDGQRDLLAALRHLADAVPRRPAA